MPPLSTHLGARSNFLEAKAVTNLVNPHAQAKVCPFHPRRLDTSISCESYTHQLKLTFPQLPGYGLSTPSTTGSDKLTIGSSILEGVRATFDPASSPQHPLKVILAGHDRGARICHRLCVSASSFPSLSITAAILLDIVPTLTEFQSFANPHSAVGYFHWSFLPNVELATKMIMALGGAAFCTEIHEKSLGGNAKGREKFFADNAAKVYASFFEEQSVVRASCEDYRAAAEEDLQAQEDDQREGRKLKVPTLVMYSERNLGRFFDVRGVWKEWVGKGTSLEVQKVGEDKGHYLPEEAAQEVLRTILEWWELLERQE